MTSLFIELIDRVLNESKQFCYGRIRKLRIPNASVEIKKANLYGASTGAVVVRFSNAAAVNVTWSTNVRAVSEANRRNSFGWLDLRSSLSIQPFEGSRFVRGGRYGISIDCGLEVVEKESVCGAIFKSKFIKQTMKPRLRIASS